MQERNICSVSLSITLTYIANSKRTGNSTKKRLPKEADILKTAYFAGSMSYCCSLSLIECM